MTTAPLGRIACLLGEVRAAGSFAARRTAAGDDLHLEVKGVGVLRLPVSRPQAEQLCRIARPARYGQGEQTLLDRRVRDTWEVPRSRVRIDRRRWNRTLVPVLEALRAEGLTRLGAGDDRAAPPRRRRRRGSGDGGGAAAVLAGGRAARRTTQVLQQGTSRGRGP